MSNTINGGKAQWGCCVMLMTIACLSVLAATFTLGMAYQSMRTFGQKLDKTVADSRSIDQRVKAMVKRLADQRKKDSNQ